ncbi:MAG TPA: hypothetical protein VHW95_10045 [Steroidobacteraceae bacterium]|nr:hypothetical protein [Steroidobacteraceae bacterium]
MLGLSGCVGDPGGTLGLVFGVFGVGLEDGGGISGALGGTDGDVGGGGVCCVQPAVIAARAIAASVILGAFILHSYKVFVV